jgi:phosphoribosylformimino-5-aminoimidazole carboxamide ribotide isomerase
VKIIPAIDLHDGKCVRLYKGDFGKVTHYSDQPLEIARTYAALSVNDLHIVDLDGARTGSQQNERVVRELCSATPLAVQLGGGIRNGDRVRYWLGNGVARCVVGSVAVGEPARVAAWIDDFGPGLWDMLDRYATLGAKHVLCTDISRDGAMSGPNIELYSEIMRRYPEICLQASGGVRDIGDIARLKDIGVPAAITGKAMLDGKISAAEVDSFLRSA